MSYINTAYISAKEAAMEYANNQTAKELGCSVFEVPYRKAINPEVAMKWQDTVSEYLERNFFNR